MNKKNIIFIVGPTASGKTAVSVSLSKKVKGEVVSCDSMQVYKGMSIVSSMPGTSQRNEVRHHLVNMLSPEKDYDASRYRKDALKKINEIIEKGKIPVFSGGTGLYMSVLIDGIFKLKKPDPQIREGLYKEAQEKGNVYLYRRLKKVDREAALKIHPNDTKRIIRALEVFISSGKPITALQKERKGLSADFDVRVFCLDLPRGHLYEKIGARVEKMFRLGLVNEVKKLLRMKLSRTASYAIGIREIEGYLSGRYDLNEAKRLIKQNTRNYAKRQLTWFRKDKRICWVNLDPGESAGKTAERIYKIWKERS